jgi:hypothetical protein
VIVDGKLKQQATPGVFPGVSVTLSRHSEIVIEYEDGIGIVPPEIDPHPGESPSSLKVLDAKVSPGLPRQIEIEVAGLGGRSYSLELVSSLPNITAEGATIHKTPDGNRLDISFEATGYVTRTIKIHY